MEPYERTKDINKLISSIISLEKHCVWIIKRRIQTIRYKIQKAVTFAF